MHSRRADQRRQRGLTLVELLVSMLIMGFVLTLVSQAIFQVAQVARSAQEVGEDLAGRWAAGWAAAPVIANLVAPAETRIGEAFVGAPDRLAGYTTQPPFGTDAGVRRFVLELRLGNSTPGSELVASEPGEFGRRVDEASIARFPVRTEFGYRDAGGNISPVWPANTVRGGGEDPDLPSAVLVLERGTQRVLAWYGFQGETMRPRTPANPFGRGG
jgi:general secretion pathway protein J